MPIKKLEYKDFSWDLHQKAGNSPIVVQIELTYRCPLHCEHCHTDCYNDPESKRRELATRQIKAIMDKCKDDGLLWLCFTGGDPMTREDFAELYLYAKRLGLITTVFSSLVLINNKILKVLKQKKPFNIETTLNAADKKTYRVITKTNLFKKHINAIKLLIKNDIPVRVKTQITRQNGKQVKKIKALVEDLGLNFRPSTLLNARLNQDSQPCSLRVEPANAIRVNKRYGFYDEQVQRPGERLDLKDLIKKPESDKLLSCAAGGHSFYINPYGEMALCGFLNNYSYDLLKRNNTVKEGFDRLNKKIHSLKFKTDSKCRSCKYRLICRWCPARAFLEKGSLEEPIEYFCRLTKETIKEQQRKTTSAKLD